MLSARSVMGMGGWSRIPGGVGAHTGRVSMKPERGGRDSPNASMCTCEHV